MKNVIVANFPSNGYKAAELMKITQAQSEVSKFFGWKEEDFIIVSNKDKCCNFGTWVRADLNKSCLTGSKLFAVEFLYENNIVSDDIWAHDLDAWQNSEFIVPEFLDAGFSQYSRPKINGGSQFWKKSGLDILKYTIDLINKRQSPKEEPCIQEMYPKFSSRVSVLDHSYNIGCSGFVERFERAFKPIQVCHLHPTNRIAWQTHALDRNGLGYKSVCENLENILRSFYTLQTELDEEGKKARINKINARLKNNK